MLSVIYKLASGTIAERLKHTLENIILESQTGFIKGRFISDSTRLVYDIMHATEVKNIPWHLLKFNEEINFYPTAPKGCQGIVFTHGGRMGNGRVGGGKEFVRAVSQKP